MNDHALGIDVGTSGIRACLIDAQGTIRAQTRCDLPAPQRTAESVEQDPLLWHSALFRLLDAMQAQTDLSRVRGIALDGTSGTLLHCASDGTVQTPALMYNDARATREAAAIAATAPRECGAHGASSGLAKALWLQHHYQLGSGRFLNQADWLTGCLSGHFDRSDENNALKLGYDLSTRRWPDWLEQLGLPHSQLPDIVVPGTRLAPLIPELAARWNMPHAQVCAGTTDSTAAFIATGAARPGEAVTSLGSTLVLKVLSERPVFAPEYGVYSHRLGDLWLAGGASNSGGAVLSRYFSPARLRELESKLDPQHPTGLDYYPLSARGERFPMNDPQLQPRLTPRPEEDSVFLQGLLEGIARIEQQGYRLLERLGAPYPSCVFTSGGGARNAAWQQLRATCLGVPVSPAVQQDAAYGAALLAQRSLPAEAS